MRTLSLTALIVSGFVQPMRAQFRIERVLIEPNIGIGISTLPDKMLSPPLALMGSVTVETTHGGAFVIEAGGVNFRDAAFPQKHNTLLFSHYVRRNISFYGARIGKTFLLNDAGQRLALTVGLNSLDVIEPIGIKPGILYSAIEKDTSSYLNIPLQIEYHVLRKHNPSRRLVFTARWNFNAYHSFPILGVGYKAAIFRNRKI